MALMEQMREYTKAVLIILVLAFIGTIIFDWGMDVTGLKQKQGVIAEINGQEISVDQFWRTYQQELENYRRQYGTEPSQATQEYLRNQVWDAMVRDILVQQEIQKRGLKAYDEEILHYILNEPPEILKRDSTFMTNGQFDRAKYEAALRNPQADPFWKNVEDYLRAILPFQKFQDEFASLVYVTESEVREEYLKRNQKAKVEYLFIDVNRFADAEIEVSDDEIKAYYEEHKDEYKEPEKRKIDYVIYSKLPTKRDTAEVEQLANDLLLRAKSGEDFAELAGTYSADNSASQGGDLGFFKRGTMVKPFEDAAFGAKVGEIVGPVRTRYGLHIIKVTDRKKENGEEMVRASHILLKFEASPQTIEAARDSAGYFAALAREESWEKAVEAEKAPAQTSPYFPEGSGFVPGIGVEREVARFVFRNEVGSISDPIETEQGFVVVRIADRQKSRTKSLDEVRAQIEAELRRQKQKALAGEFARKIKKDIDNGESLEVIAKRDSLEHKITEPFTRNGFIPGVGRDPAFIGTAFALNVGAISEPVEGIRGYYILKLLEKTEFDEEDYKAKADLIRKELERRKQQQAFAQWYENLKSRAKIKDYRNRYF